MAYLIRDTVNSMMLIELTEAQARKAVDMPLPNGGGYTRIDARRAHRWVREGGVHATMLYIDADNRIRRAG